MEFRDVISAKQTKRINGKEFNLVSHPLGVDYPTGREICDNYRNNGYIVEFETMCGMKANGLCCIYAKKKEDNITSRIIKTMLENGVRPDVPAQCVLSIGELPLLVKCTISSSRKSYHYTYTNDVEHFFEKTIWRPDLKTLYVRPANYGSFIGRNGTNIRELQRIWNKSGFDIKLMKEGE